MDESNDHIYIHMRLEFSSTLENSLFTDSEPVNRPPYVFRYNINAPLDPTRLCTCAMPPSLVARGAREHGNRWRTRTN